MTVRRDVHQMREVEEALRRSEAKYRQIFEKIQDIFFQTDDQGLIVEVSPSVERYGYTREELIGSPAVELYEEPKQRITLRQLLEKGEITDSEARLKTRDGRVIDFSVSSHVLWNADGSPAGMEGCLRDITDRKRAEEALRDSEEEIRAITHTAMDAIIMIDNDGLISYWNPAAERLFGHTAQEALGKELHTLLVPQEHHPSYREGFSRFQTTGQGAAVGKTLELSALRKDGTEFPIELSLSAVHIAGTWHAIGIVRDISDRKRAEEELNRHHDRLEELVDERTAELTRANEELQREVIERRQAEEALRRSEQYFSKAFHAAPLSIAISKVGDGRFVDANDAFMQLVGRGREEVIGRTSLELGLWADLDDRRWLVESIQKSGVARDFESRVRRRSGEVRDTLSSFVALELDGEPCLLGMTRDVTERKMAREALRESEQRFRQVLDVSSDLVYKLNLESGTFDYVSPSVLSLTGFTPQEVIDMGPRGVFHRVHPEDWQHYKRGLEEFPALRSEVRHALRMEFRWQCKDGEYRWFADSRAIVRGDDGRPLAVVGTIRDVTERRQAEEELQKSVRLLGDTGEMAKVGGWELDLSTNEVSWTEEVGRIHGVEPGYKPKLEEALNFYAPESRPAVEAVVKKAAETGEPYDLESLFIPLGSKDKIWVRSLGKAVYSGGRIVKLAGTFQNIDKYKRADEALRKSEERHRILFETIAQGIVYQAADGKIISANPAAERILGLTIDQMRGRTSIDPRWKAIHKDGSDFPGETHPSMAALKTGRKVLNVVMGVFNPKDDSHRWININAIPLFKPGENKPYQVYTTFEDITERKLAEEALRESEERFRTLSASAPVGIMLVDNKDGLVYCNERLLAIYGLPLEEILGFGWVKYVHPDDREALLAERSEAMAEGREFVREFRIVTPQGVARWVRARTTTVSSQEGMSNARVGTLADITEHRQAEEQARQLHAEHVRANELGRMVRILEQMAATLGHELRNPLGVIGNSVYFLANQAQIDDPKAQKHVEIIGREVAGARRVIDDILEFAHVPQLLPAAASINAVVDSALARSQIPANIRVVRKLAVDLPPLICDEERLERAFIDVIANAVQAMPHGGRIGVKTSQSGDEIKVVVSDSGVGIARENIDKVFDPMFTTKLRGIGLGLTVVRRTVEQHGGGVSVRSHLGRGAVFTIVLPRDCRPFGAKGGRVA